MMMRRIFSAIAVFCFCAALAFSVSAQDTSTPSDIDMMPTLSHLATQVAVEAQAAREGAQASDENIDRAFNLLGIFEVGGVLITVIAGGVGVFGFSRLLSAQSALARAREDVQNELKAIRKTLDEELRQQKSQLETQRIQFESQLAEKEADLDRFRTELEKGFVKQRDTTAKALLAQSWLALGERHYKAQDYEGAIGHYQRALELDPMSPITHYRLGYVYMHKGNLETARQYFSSSTQLEENFAPAIVGLGLVYRRMAEKMTEGIDRNFMMTEAEQLMLRGLKLSNNLIDDDGESWWGALGGLYRRRGQTDDAIRAYERATEVTPNSSYGLGNLARLYVKKGDRQGMVDTYRRVEKIAWAEAQSQDNNYYGYADVVVSRLALGKFKEAEDVLDTTLELVSAEYQLDSLKETLMEVAEVVEGQDRTAIKAVIERIEAWRVKRFAKPENESSESTLPTSPTT